MIWQSLFKTPRATTFVSVEYVSVFEDVELLLKGEQDVSFRLPTILLLRKLCQESSYITGTDINVSGGNVMGGARG